MKPELGISENISKHLVGFKNKNVLDAGCGNGNKIPHLIQEFGENIYGCDLSDCVLDNVKKLNKKIYTNSELENMTFFSNDFFDFIYCCWVLDKRDFYNCLREYNRVLKTGGLVYIHYANMWLQHVLIVKSQNNVLMDKCKCIVLGFLRENGYFYENTSYPNKYLTPFFEHSYNNMYEIQESINDHNFEIVLHEGTSILLKKLGNSKTNRNIYDTQKFISLKNDFADKVNNIYQLLINNKKEQAINIIENLNIDTKEKMLIFSCLSFLILDVK